MIDAGRRWRRLIALPVAAAVAAFTLLVAPLWMSWAYGTFVPRWAERVAIEAVLKAVRVAYVAAVLASPLAIGLGMWRWARGHRRGIERRWSGRIALAGLAVLPLLPFLEAGAALRERVLHRWPPLPTSFPAETAEPIDLVVIGESSARGEPYHPWLSMGSIMADALQRVLQRPVRVAMLAQGGICLEQAIGQLQGLERRPEIVLVFSGHNEFQARFGWSRSVPHYHDDPLSSRLAVLRERLNHYSSVCRLIDDAIERNGLDRPPPPQVTRSLVDHPVVTPEGEEFLQWDFGRRYNALLRYCRWIGAVAIAVVPPGNDADYPPARSYLDPATPRRAREAIARRFNAARSLEVSDPAAAEQAYRALLRDAPEFSEAHYRLGQILRATGRPQEARGHLARARDLDGMPMRCPGPFQEAIRVAARRHGAVLVDGPEVLGRLAPDGLVGDNFLHDAQHPSLRGYVALAQEALNALARRRALGWPVGVPVPQIDAAEVAAAAGMDRSRWVEVARRSAQFYGRTATMRHDPREHHELARRWTEAASAIEAGAALEGLGLPTLGPLAADQPSRRASQSEAASSSASAFSVSPASARGIGARDRSS